MYMRLEKSLDKHLLEKSWVHAVELAKKFCGPQKLKETIKNACERLVDIKRYEAAAEIYYSVGEMYKEAIDCCAKGHLWDKVCQIFQQKIGARYCTAFSKVQGISRRTLRFSLQEERQCRKSFQR